MAAERQKAVMRAYRVDKRQLLINTFFFFVYYLFPEENILVKPTHIGTKPQAKNRHNVCIIQPTLQ
jgi:hypothetical protein